MDLALILDLLVEHDCTFTHTRTHMHAQTFHVIISASTERCRQSIDTPKGSTVLITSAMMVSLMKRRKGKEGVEIKR